jgi:hypothetical protein
LIVLALFSFPALILNGKAPHHFGIANLSTKMKITKNISNGQISVSKRDHRVFSLNFTSTITVHVIEIPKSPKEVPKGFLVS